MKYYSGAEAIEVPDQHAEIEKVLGEYSERGVKVVLLYIPDGGHSTDDAYARVLSSKFGFAVLDLRDTFAKNSLKYTDGLHLSAKSAQLVTDVIQRLCTLD